MKKLRVKGRPATPEEIAASLAAFDLFADDPVDEAAAVPTVDVTPAEPAPPRALSWDRDQPGGMTDELWDLFASHG
jgi:hypothetical protein